MEANALAVVAIIAAVYAVLSQAKRIDLELRFSVVDMFVLFMCSVVLLYCLYLPVLNAIGLALPLTWWWGFNENLLSFTVSLFVIFYFLTKLAGKRLPKSRIKSWQKVASQLARNQDHKQLALLLENYHSQFLGSFKERWYDRLRAKVLAPYEPCLQKMLRQMKGEVENESKADKAKSYALKLLKPFAILFAKCLPDRTKYRQELDQSISGILKSYPFVKHLTQTNPMLCAEYTTTRFNGCDEFSSAFFKGLVTDNTSSLYRELRDNQHCSHTGEYYIDEFNPLLNFYLSDINVASKIEMYRPIAECTKEYIGKQKGSGNYYNLPFSYLYMEEDCWNCQIFISIQFFKVMVSRAIHSGYNDHMWLMYVEDFVDRMLTNYEPNVQVDRSGEFPTRFDYLMYMAFDAVRDWVEAAVYVSIDESDLGVDNRRGPIPYAATTLGSLLFNVIKSQKLSDQQCRYYLDMVIRTLNKLDDSGNQELCKLVVGHLVKRHDGAKPDVDVISELLEHYRRIDHVLKRTDSTFEIEMSSYHEPHCEAV